MIKLLRGIIKKSKISENEMHQTDSELTIEAEDNHATAPFAQTDQTISLDEAIALYKPNFMPKQRKMDKESLKKCILYSVALGDISGSRYEGSPYPGMSTSEIFAMRRTGETYPIYDGWRDIDLFTEGHRFTDDTVLTIAIYKATQKLKEDGIDDADLIVGVYSEYLKHYARRYPDAGYAAGFEKWAMSETNDRNFSFGNGACMRVGGIAIPCDKVEDVIRYAYYSALPSHGHNEGIKGAVCTAVIYWMLSFGATKDEVLRYIQKQYPSDNGQKINSSTTLDKLIDMNKLNPWSTLSVICQTSLVEAVINFLESDSFESCLRNSYRYLCDRDTISAIAAPMASIYYGDFSVSGISGEEIVKRYLDENLLNEL